MSSVLRRLRRNTLLANVEDARHSCQHRRRDPAWTSPRDEGRWGKRRRLVLSPEIYRLAERRGWL